MSENINETSGIARRSVVKAAAWAAPVVAVAVSAPLASASIIDGFSGLNVRSNQAGTQAEFRSAECYVELVSDDGTENSGPITFTFNVPEGFTASNGGNALGNSGTIGDWTYTFGGGVYTLSHAGVTLNSPGTTVINVPNILINRTDSEAPALSSSNRITATLTVPSRPNLNKSNSAPA